MNAKLQYWYDQLEHDRINLLAELTDVGQEKLDRQSDGTHWSINQILIHLLTAEQLTLRYLKNKSLGIDGLKNAGPIESAKMLLLKISQRIPFMKYRAPKILIANTPDVMPLSDLTANWNLSRLNLKDFLEAVEDKNLRKLIYKHPVAGRFDVVQCLTFLREHFHHHLPQIRRQL